MSRGIITLVWGENRFFKESNMSTQYNKSISKLPVCLITDTDNEHKIIDRTIFDKIIIIESIKIPKFHKGKGYILKTLVPQVSPFEEILYLDSDAYIINTNLEYGFNQAKIHGMCLVQDFAYSLFDYRYLEPEVTKLTQSDYLIQYNGGVFFLNKCHKNIKRVTDDWQKLSYSASTLIMPQTLLSIAFYNNNYNPVTLPWTWNYRPHYKSAYAYGDIKIWHSRSCLFDKTREDFYKNWKMRKEFLH
jgi:hypothetical protein